MFYTAVEARQSAISTAREHLQAIARYAALALERDIGGARHFLSALADVLVADHADPVGCEALLVQIVTRYPRFANLLVITPSGAVTCQGIEMGQYVNLASRDYVQLALREGEAMIGGATFGGWPRRPVLPLAHPIKDGSGQVRAVLTAELCLVWLSRSLLDMQLPPSLTFALWERTGQAMARYPDPETWVGRRLPDAPLRRALYSERPGTTVEGVGVDGIERIFAIAQLPYSREAGLWIGAGTAKADLYAHPDRVFAHSLWLGWVALAALVAAGILGERLIRRPAAALVQAAEGLSKGDYDKRIGPPYRPGELGELARAFDTMADSLQRSRRETERYAEDVRRLNEDLERRVAERTAQLELTNKELESFSYSVSHDLRSPLRAIDGFSQMLQEDYHDRLDDEGRRIIQVIRDSAAKMGMLIEDLLAFSRTGRKAIEATECEMGALTQKVFRELQAIAGAKRIEFRVHPMPIAWGDRILLGQVWVNLLGNAIKFSETREHPMIEVGGYESDTENVYYVKDNGVGLDMRYYDKLFSVFQRLHSAEEFPGTGVGLAIVQRVVVRHGGRVWAESKLGEGATFYFSLPRRRA
jgi:signal transduction histidine kinase